MNSSDLQYAPCVEVKDGPLVDDISEVALLLGGTVPRHIVVGLKPWCFVTKRGIRTCAGCLNGSTLYLSLPLLRLLTKDEVLSVMAHELAHLQHRHFGIRHLVGTFGVLLSDVGGGRGGYLKRQVFFRSYFKKLAVRWEQSLERRKLSYEFVADRAGASLAGEEAMRFALVKSCRLLHLYQIFEQANRDLSNDGTRLVNQSEALASLVDNYLASAPPKDILVMLRVRLRALSKNRIFEPLFKKRFSQQRTNLTLTYDLRAEEEFLSSLC